MKARTQAARRAASQSRWLRRIAALATVPVLLSACVADPPPPRSPGDANNETVDIAPDAINVVLESLGPGLNPHVRADQGTDTDLLSALTLPSAYYHQPDGTFLRNSGLVESVTLLNDEPFTLRYVLNNKAQWSDGVPIAAEDFRYLWRQLAATPGGTSADAGYRYITDIRAGGGGKTIDVQFDRPYPRWRELFANLLPAHLMGDGGPSFGNVLAQGAPASGGPFRIAKADLGIGEIVLVRNERYWNEPARADQVVVRQAPDQSALGQSARTGQADVVVIGADDVNKLVLDTVGGYGTTTTRSSSQLTLTWNTTAPGLDSAELRRALAQFVDARAVGEIVTGTAGTTVSAYPSPGMRQADVADPQRGRQALRALGFDFDGRQWMRDGVPLEVTIGVQAGDTETLLAATTVADQLRSEGIGARAWELESADLYSGALPYGIVQAVLTWNDIAGSPLSTANGRYRCVAAPSTAGSSATAQTSSTGADDFLPDIALLPGELPGATQTVMPPPATVTELNPPPEVVRGMTNQTSTADGRDEPALSIPVPTATNGEPQPPAARLSNLSGFCDADVDEALDRADAQEANLPASRPGPQDSGSTAGATSAAVGNTQQLDDDLAQRLRDAAIDVPLVVPQQLVATHVALRGFTQFPAAASQTTSSRDLFVNSREWSVS